MENLSIQDAPPPQQQQGPPPVPQLPPQLFTTAASMLELTDKKLLITLRDGRKLTGILRSWDQFGNLVLQSTVERRFLKLSAQPEGALAASHIYTDEERGLYLVRGENIVLMGEIDLDKDDMPPPPNFALVTPHQMHLEEKRVGPSRKRKDTVRAKKLLELGFEEEHRGEVLI